MSRSDSVFRQADITKAVKAVTRAGQAVDRVEVDHEGKIVVVCAKEAAGTPAGNGLDLSALMGTDDDGPKKRRLRAS